MRTCLIYFALPLFWACQPAKSDINVEIVNTQLLQNLVKGADSVIPIPLDTARSVTQPLWVNGDRLVFTTTSKSIILWYDEQGRLSGMLEFEQEHLKDSMAFFPNGQRMFTLVIDKQGKASGPTRYYHPNGRVREDGRFTGGIKTGIWREFDEEGRLITTREFDRYGQPSR